MRVEPVRSSVHRLAPVALAALGIFGALLTIFAGLVALNHTVLPFNGWPRDAERLDAGRQVLPRAPVEESGRLRTAPGGAPAGASIVLHTALSVAVVEPRTVSLVGLSVRRGRTHAAPPRLVGTPTPQRPSAVPQPTPAPAPAPVSASAPAQPVAPAIVSPAPISRAPLKSTSSPSSPSGPGKGQGHGRATAPGQLKKAARQAQPASAAAAPASPAPAAPAVAPAEQDDSPGNSGNAPGHANGHGPPPWAHGHH